MLKTSKERPSVLLQRNVVIKTPEKMHPVVLLVAGFLSLAGGAEIKVLLEGQDQQLNRQERRLANTEVIRIQEIGETIVVQVQEETSAKGRLYF